MPAGGRYKAYEPALIRAAQITLRRAKAHDRVSAGGMNRIAQGLFHEAKPTLDHSDGRAPARSVVPLTPRATTQTPELRAFVQKIVDGLRGAGSL